MFVLNEQNTLANHFLAELRDINIQVDPMRFRKNLERLGEVLAYELSKKINYVSKDIKTPLGTSEVMLIYEQPVMITILRAGLPFFQGFLNFFDKAECGFIGAYRNPHDERNYFDISMEYVAIPSLQNRVVIIIDPMLATGKSLVKSINNLFNHVVPAHVHIVSAIAAPEGINHIKKNIKFPFSIWTGALDEKLNDKSYIVPGLGDAGDLSFGSKL